MKTSCTSPWSLLVTNTHPPQLMVLTTATNARTAGRVLCGRRWRCEMNETRTRRKRGPEVRAMRSWKTLRSGNQSPMVLWSGPV